MINYTNCDQLLKYKYYKILSLEVMLNLIYDWCKYYKYIRYEVSKVTVFIYNLYIYILNNRLIWINKDMDYYEILLHLTTTDKTENGMIKYFIHFI